jgi:hypothetical protein
VPSRSFSGSSSQLDSLLALSPMLGRAIESEVGC